jgi:hypothetical protein
MKSFITFEFSIYGSTPFDHPHRHNQALANITKNDLLDTSETKMEGLY